MVHIEGLVTAPFTAMNSNRSINLNVIEKQAEFYSANNLAGVFICGTTGEGMSLTLAERLEIAERWCKVADKKLKVIVHVGENSIEACKKMANQAQKSGAYAVGMIAPSFFKPATVDVLVDYCSQVAASAPELPFYFYHMPSMTGVNFSMVSFLEKASGRIPNLAGIKYTYEDLMDYYLCRTFEGGRFDILFGRDEILLCGLALGAKGAVGSTYNFAAPLYYQLISEFNHGNLEKARALQQKSMEMIKILASAGCSFLAVSKALMKRLGVDCGPVRLPLTDITDKQYESVISKLEEIGFFKFCGGQTSYLKSKTKSKCPISEIKV
jgi:N-acetylneuraminate lyase